jgi:hypothetical protein
MAKKKTIQNLKVGIFNDMTPQTNYGLVNEMAPKWAQSIPEQENSKPLKKAKVNKKTPGHNSGHRK